MANDVDVARSVGERRYVALLGFLEWALVEAIVAQNPYSFDAESREAAREAYTCSVRAVAMLSAAAAPGELRTMSTDMAAGARQRAARAYRDPRALDGRELAMVRIDELLAPQFDVDLEFIDELVRGLTRPVDVDCLLDLAFPITTVAAPIIRGSDAFFSSDRRTLFRDPSIVTQRTEEGDYLVSVRVRSRENCIEVARFPDGQLILANGLHRVLALERIGIQEVPCLWRSIGSVAELGVDPHASHAILQRLMTRGPRPALVSDFLNPELSIAMRVRATDLVLRVSIQSETFTIPAVPR
jgi:hypothetical protein